VRRHTVISALDALDNPTYASTFRLTQHERLIAFTGMHMSIEPKSKSFESFLASRESYLLRCGAMGCSGVLRRYGMAGGNSDGQLSTHTPLQQVGAQRWIACPICQSRNFLSRPGWYGPGAIVRIERLVA
jgi:hypothetical protein